MKYLIVTDPACSINYPSLLVEEIRRFDIRAEIFVNEGGEVVPLEDEMKLTLQVKTIKLKSLGARQYDLLIAVGTTFDKKLVRQIRAKGIKTCFFHITEDFFAGKKVHSEALNYFDRIFTDLPVFDSHSKSEQIGHYFNDLLRKHDFTDQSSGKTTIALLASQTSHVSRFTRLIRKLSADLKDVDWVLSCQLGDDMKSKLDAEENIQFAEDRLSLLKCANAVIVASEKDSIEAALLNCPQVSISGKQNLFGFTKVKEPLINRILGESLVNNFVPGDKALIAQELNSILNDHEYCASMLTGYQTLKDRIGNQPVARTAAQKLVDWLEE